MSKSRGNIVRAEPIHKVMGADALRYFLLREVVFGQDGSFSYDALIGRYNSDLANGLGQSGEPHADDDRAVSRRRNPAGAAIPVEGLADRLIATTVAAFDAFEFSRGLETVWALISRVDKFIVEMAPWNLAKQGMHEPLDETLYTAAEALRIVTVLLYPVMPESTEKIWSQLGMHGPLASVQLPSLKWGQLQLRRGQKIGEVAPVFPRIEAKEAIAKMQELEVRVTEEQNVMLGKAPKPETPRPRSRTASPSTISRR